MFKNIYTKLEKYFYIVFPILLIWIIILPYIINYGQYIAGNDSSYFEFSGYFAFYRNLFFWKYFNGSGGFSFNSVGAFYFLIQYSLYLIFGSLITQILTKIFFYFLGYYGIIYLLKYVSTKAGSDLNFSYAHLLAFFFCTNLLIYDLNQAWLYLYYAFTFSLPFLIYFCIKFLNNGKYKYLLLFALIAIINTPSLVNPSFPAIQYLALLIFYIIFERKHYYRFLIVIAIFSLINSMAIMEYYLTLVLAKDNIQSNDVNMTLVNTAPLKQKLYFQLVDLFTFTGNRILNLKRWTISGPEHLLAARSVYTNPVAYTVLLIPFYIIIQSFTKKSETNKFTPTVTWLRFFFLTSLVMISMFAFQPIEDTLITLFDRFSFLWVFRNSLKFNVILIPLTIILLYLAAFKTKYLQILFFFHLIFLNIYSFTGGFADRHSFTYLPDVYKQMDSEISNLDFGLGDRIMSFPAVGIVTPVYNFEYRGYQPVVVLQNSIPYFATNADFTNPVNNTIYNTLSTLPEDINIWKEYGVKYAILHHDLTYIAYNLDENLYRQSSDFLYTNFQEIIKNENYSIFQVYNDNSPLINTNSTTSEIEYEFVNPSQININIKNIKDEFDLVLNQSYNKNWSVYINKYENSICDKEVERKIIYTQNNKGCKLDLTIFSKNELTFFSNAKQYYRASSSEDIQKNRWSFDTKEINYLYPEEYYKINNDNSFDISFTLYFEPQSYLLKGAIIYTTTISLLIIGHFLKLAHSTKQYADEN